jgi:hypothetical protein
MSINGSSVPQRAGSLRYVGMLAGRSLFPLVTVIILGGTVLWGPWVTMALAIVWFAAGSLAC